MTVPKVVVRAPVINDVRQHALDEARKYGHEVLGWLVGFFRQDEVYVLKAVRCTKYRRQSRIEAEADPGQESEIASRYLRDVGLVGLYHSHPFRHDYREMGIKGLKDAFAEKMFHSEVDRVTLSSRAKRKENYLSVVTDGKNVTFFVYDKEKKDAAELTPHVLDSVDHNKLLTNYSAKINLVFETDIRVKSSDDVIKELEGYLIDYIYRNIEESEVKFESVTEKRCNVRLYAFEEEPVGDNIIRIEQRGNSYHVNLRLRISPEVFVTRREDVLRAMRDEIADNILYLIRKSFKPTYLGDGKIGLLEFHLGNFRTDKYEYPTKSYVPPKRRMIMRKR
jgi:hypothetical protein